MANKLEYRCEGPNCLLFKFRDPDPALLEMVYQVRNGEGLSLHVIGAYGKTGCWITKDEGGKMQLYFWDEWGKTYGEVLKNLEIESLTPDQYDVFVLNCSRNGDGNPGTEEIYTRDEWTWDALLDAENEWECLTTDAWNVLLSSLPEDEEGGKFNV